MVKVSAMLSCLKAMLSIWKSVSVKIGTFASSLQPEHIKVKHELTAIGQTGEAEKKSSVDRQGSSGKSLLIATQEQSLSWYNLFISRCLNKMFFFSFLYSDAKSNTVLGLTVKDVFPAIRRPEKRGISHMLKEGCHSSQAVGFL